METQNTQGKKYYLYGALLIVVAALLWAADGVIRRSLFSLPPIVIIFYEHLIGFAIILPFVWKKLFTTKLSRREWILIGVISLLSGVLGTLFFTTALFRVNFISFSVVFLLQKLQPIFAITTARIFLKERLHRSYIIWAVLALVGAYFVTFKDGIVSFATGAGTAAAALLALGAAAAWGSSTTFSKMMLEKRSHNYTTAMRFLVTTVMAFVFVLFMGKFSALSTPTVSQFVRFGVIALSTGMVALLIYYKGLARTPVRVSTILELTFPLVAIIIDKYLYHTTLSSSQLFAAGLLMLSMYRIAKLQAQHAI